MITLFHYEGWQWVVMYIRVGVLLLPLYDFSFRLDFGTVPTVWYFTFCIWFYCPRSLSNKLYRYIKGLWTYEIHVALIWMSLAYIWTRTHHCLRRACGQQHFIRLRYAWGKKHVISQSCLWHQHLIFSDIGTETNYWIML